MADETPTEALDLLKQTFVKEWLRTNDPFQAGLACYPCDNGRALRASWEWTVDAAVLAYRQSLIDNGQHVAGLPGKEELALEVYRRATKAALDEDAFEGFELVAKIMGYIEKPSVNIDNRSMTVNNRVMVVKDHGSTANWEQKLAENQKTLTLAAAKPN